VFLWLGGYFFLATITPGHEVALRNCKPNAIHFKLSFS